MKQPPQRSQPANLAGQTATQNIRVQLQLAQIGERAQLCRERPAELVVGPYQGTLACLRIEVGRGVCGTAAAERRTVVVPDVHAFAGHIACDAATRSEIVVPVFAGDGTLAAVLDVDSTESAAFSAVDQAGLESICGDLLTV